MGTQRRLAVLFGVLALIWTVLVVALGTRDWFAREATKYELAVHEARAAYHKDVAYRQWATHHGGVYVPISESTPPNPYLHHIPDRDVNTTDGQRLTLVNPAYMTRQVHELPETQYELKGKLTSLQPLRAENAPDSWERHALQRMTAEGLSSVHALSPFSGEPYLRFMGPMIAEGNCLKCHANQGYEEGDLIGGISIRLPWAPYATLLAKGRKSDLLVLAVLWGIGLVAVMAGFGYLRRDLRLRQAYEKRAQRQEALLHETQARAQRYLQTVDVAIVVLDTRGRIQEANPALGRLVKMDESALIGLEWIEHFVPQRLQQEVQEAFEAIITAKSGTLLQYENPVVAGDEERIVSWRSTPLMDTEGHITGLLAAGNDVTGQKEAQQALETLNQTLEERVEEEVARRRQSEQAMVQQSRVAAMGEMVTAISHHWRQPLSVVALTVQSLRDEYLAGTLDEKRLEAAIAVSMEKIHEMSHSIDALRGVAQERQPSEQCCLLEQAQEAYRVLQAEFEQSGIEVLGRCFNQPAMPLDRCRCDPQNARVRLIASDFRQVVFALLINARDAIWAQGRGGGRIVLGLDYDGDYEQMTIEDSGGGIPPEAMERLFEPFFTTKERGQGSGVITGAGLGLYLAKMIIEEQMGGTITAENTQQGAKMIVRLPIDPL
jgi:PAS domain S-box-containing protein